MLRLVVRQLMLRRLTVPLEGGPSPILVVHNPSDNIDPLIVVLVLRLHLVRGLLRIIKLAVSGRQVRKFLLPERVARLHECGLVPHRFRADVVFGWWPVVRLYFRLEVDLVTAETYLTHCLLLPECLLLTCLMHF